MSTVPNVSIKDFFNKVLTSLEKSGTDLKAQMDQLLNGEEISPEVMMALQYQLSMYNMLIEAANAILTSLASTAKNVAQRMG